MNRHTLLLLIISVFGHHVSAQQATTELRDDFKKYYESFQVEGAFVLFDPQDHKYIVYNKEMLARPLTPASTFKICNSLIGLETGVIKDASYVIPWDSVTRQNPMWNTDHDLKSAFRNSAVWYYQELAKRVGGKQMKYWLDKANYGNADTSGGIDRFWLTGGLRISMLQQIDFLVRLHDNKLPFSMRSMEIVKSIMIVKDTLDDVIRAKTGWGMEGNRDIGWYVGYVEKNGKVYYFANCILSQGNNNNFAFARTAITDNILKDLKLIDP